MNTETFFDQQLAECGQAHQQSYVSADPFPHIVLDDFFPDDLLGPVADAVERPNAKNWIQRNETTSFKSGCRDETVMDPLIRRLIHHLNAGPFLLFLEALTGIDGLIPDPHLFGGGMHQIEPGGFLKIHADFNVNEKLKLDRRLNALIYLNRDWREEYGGHLELWDREMKGCVQQILPIFNRLVVFSTTDYSFHGHPNPLSCPPGTTRKSIALYYYTNGRPASERSRSHSTIYRARPGEELPSGNSRAARLLAFASPSGVRRTISKLLRRS